MSFHNLRPWISALFGVICGLLGVLSSPILPWFAAIGGVLLGAMWLFNGQRKAD